jgi:CRP-like cAMP-binding protein
MIRISETEAVEKFSYFLKSIVLFDPKEFNLALPYFNIRFLKKGEHFAEEGKVCRNFAFIISGFMRAFRYEKGEEITLCLCSENLLATSTASFILQKPSDITITATEPTVLLTIGHSDLNMLYEKSTFWAKVGRVVTEREFLEVECRNRCYAKMNPEEKYKTLILENPDILNRVSLRIIASYLGITPETLSRIRKKIVKPIS